jgi:2,3-diaminopropionate biosynthesis protein SbnB
MIYLNEKDIVDMGIDWNACSATIREAVISLSKLETVQPVKPYLRFKDLKNRIIAMPAYVGGKFDIAGIKWIASFPNNIKKDIPRASSVTVLNDSNTGQVVSIINTNLISVIRTVSVSALLMNYFFKHRAQQDLTLGIIGFGPIGQFHYKMCESLFGNKISEIVIYDVKGIQDELVINNPKVKIVKSWEEAYVNSDIVITCTVSSERYIDKKPKSGSLLLNVSLRDYKTDIFEFVKDSIIVDDWEEICRENTDIEVFHKEKNLQKENTKSIIDVVVDDCLKTYSQNQPIMFNPMGMAIFDIAIAKYYLELAKKLNIGTLLS